MNFRVELPAVPESPQEIAAMLLALRYALAEALRGFDDIGVILNVSGTDMVALKGELVGTIVKRWEDCRPREPVSTEQRSELQYVDALFLP